MRLIMLTMLSSASLAAFSNSAIQSRVSAEPVQRVRSPLSQESSGAGANSPQPAQAGPLNTAPSGRSLLRGSQLNLLV
jgi:hypothetical protein